MGQQGMRIDHNFSLPVVSGPARVSDALVFELKDADAARSAWMDFKAGSTPVRGVSAACRYAHTAAEQGARLTALYPERAAHAWREPFCEIVAPAPPPPDAKVNLSATHHLRLADREDGAWLFAELSQDPRVRRVYRPAAHYPLDAPGPPPQPGTLASLAGLLRSRDISGLFDFVAASLGMGPRERKQWGLDECGFREIWAQLDTGGMRSQIAMIDQGGDTGHTELSGRITLKNPRPDGTIKSGSIHASAVAGVLSALREPPTGISGCCSAPVDLYNAWDDSKGFDSCAFRDALKAIPRAGLKVVNISLGSKVSDADTEEQIREAVRAGLIIVAAAGNDDNTEPIYPAAYEGVIAVGATTQGGHLANWSTTGEHVYVSAPGQNVLTVYGRQDLRRWSGTSFAAPMVAAAVWMALGVQSSWGRDEILKVLAHTSTGSGKRLPGIGYGVLNMRHFARCVLAGDPLCAPA